ncbi:MAG: zinc ribbon domain-containing protein [Planctomycetota bacterium]|nr:zinc ribbon domain-containing protein [Planctomycetota bacterium]
MPTYDYACSDCGHRFEKFHSMTAEPLRQCPECKNDSLERLIGPGAGIIFKGSGFYETDYKGSRGGPSSGDKGGDNSKDSDSSSGSSTPSCGTDSSPAKKD